MAEIINLKDKIRRHRNTVITHRPWEFRKAEWNSANFIQMSRSQSTGLESRREKAADKTGMGIKNLPPHFVLKGGTGYTIRAIFSYRENEDHMREVYYLTGLMDCMINQENPVLRTDLLRAMYKEVFFLKSKLNIQWYNSLDQILLPIDNQFFNEYEYRASLKEAGTMKKLYRAIRDGTDHMFDILALEYVFYCPGAGG